jgi:hypothetical protein
MWQHDCPEEGKIEVGDNEPCSWCGAVQQVMETVESPTSSIALLEDK